MAHAAEARMVHALTLLRQALATAPDNKTISPDKQ